MVQIALRSRAAPCGPSGSLRSGNPPQHALRARGVCSRIPHLRLFRRDSHGLFIAHVYAVYYTIFGNFWVNSCGRNCHGLGQTTEDRRLRIAAGCAERPMPPSFVLCLSSSVLSQRPDNPSFRTDDGGQTTEDRGGMRRAPYAAIVCRSSFVVSPLTHSL